VLETQAAIQGADKFQIYNLVKREPRAGLADDAPPAESAPRLAAPPVESEPPRMEEEPEVVRAPVHEIEDDDRQPDFLNYRDQEPEPPEVDGNRLESSPTQQPPGRAGGASGGRRRRRRRWRGGPRQPSMGQPQA